MIHWKNRFLPRRVRWTLRNMAARCGLVCGTSSTSTQMNAEEVVHNARQYLHDWCGILGADLDVFSGKHVLEVGPGNNLATALLILSCGASKVTCVDILPKLDTARGRATYGLLRGQLDNVGARLDPLFDGDELLVSMDSDSALAYLGDCPIEEAWHRLGPNRFDLVVSRAVLEHTYSLEKSIDSTWRLLKPDGRMAHKVDLRSHDEGEEVHPLEFLTYSERCWRWMTSHTGEPNRQRKGVYVQLLRKYGFIIEAFQITHSLPREVVASLRPQLAMPFRDMPEEELTDTGILFAAHKPPAT